MSTGSLGQGFSVACGMAMASNQTMLHGGICITWRWRKFKKVLIWEARSAAL